MMSNGPLIKSIEIVLFSQEILLSERSTDERYLESGI